MMTQQILISISIIFNIIIQCIANPIFTTGFVENNITKNVNTEFVLYSMVSLKCNVSTDSALDNASITWFHNEEEVTESESIQVNQENKNLEIMNFQQKDIGFYKCIINDKETKFDSQPIKAMLKPYTELSTADASPFVIVKKHFTKRPFTAVCFVKSYPPSDVFFFKDDTKIIQNERIFMEASIVNNNEGVLRYTLTINNVTSADIGEYFCHSENRFISKKLHVNSIQLEVSCNDPDTWKCPYNSKCVSKSSCKSYGECILFNCEIPAKPSNIHVTSLTHKYVHLTWEKDDRVLGYLIKLKTANSPTKYFQITENWLSLNNLRNITHYSVFVSATNKAGKTSYAKFAFKTKRMVEPKEVSSLNVIPFKQKKNTVLLEWNAPIDDGMENKLGELKYEITYCLFINESKKQECETQKTLNRTLTISDIQNGSLYMFTIVTINKANQYGPPKGFFYRYITTKETDDTSSSASYHVTNSKLLHVVLLIVVLKF